MKWMFKIKEWKGMTMNGIYIILLWEQHGGNGIESFYDKITIRPLF